MPLSLNTFRRPVETAALFPRSARFLASSRDPFLVKRFRAIPRCPSGERGSRRFQFPRTRSTSAAMRRCGDAALVIARTTEQSEQSASNLVNFRSAILAKVSWRARRFSIQRTFGSLRVKYQLLSKILNVEAAGAPKVPEYDANGKRGSDNYPNDHGIAEPRVFIVSIIKGSAGSKTRRASRTGSRQTIFASR